MTSLHVEDVFLSHYQLSHDPFAARVPRFKFFPAQRKSVLGQLHHLARYSQLVLVVTGPLGSGKTLLRQALVASANKQTVHSVVVSARAAAEPSGLLAQIAQGFNESRGDLASIQARIGQMALTGQEVYLLVDDAEWLTDDSLAALMSLAAGKDEARAHVFLFAEPTLVPQLEALAGDEERFHVIELTPYTEEETQEYLGQRLEGAGRDIELLTEDQVASIHEQSGGWPGLVNEAARDTLISAMLAERSTKPAAGLALNMPKKHVLAIGVVFVALIAAWLMQGRANNGQIDPAIATGLPLNGAGASSSAVELPLNGASSAPSSVAAPVEMTAPSEPVMRQPLAEAASAGPEEEVVPPLTQAPVVAPVAVPSPPPVVVTPPPVALVRPPVAPAVTTPPKPVAVAPAREAPSVAAPAKAPADPAAGWYAAQPVEHYTLQVFATRSESNAKSFVSQQGNGFHYFKKLHQGQLLYVVTYGSFPSANAARAAIATLSAKVLNGSQPWPKTFASVRQEISAQR
jgi:DamX protein